MDTFNILLMGFISVVIVNNLVFTKFLGICPYLGVSGRIDMAFGMGLAVTFVVTLSGTLTWMIDNLILMKYGLEVTQYVCFILVIAGAVQLVARSWPLRDAVMRPLLRGVRHGAGD